MVQVIKADGTKEDFSEEKLLASVKRAGIHENLQQKVMDHIKTRLYDGIPTSEIYKHILEFLQKSDLPFSSTKYSLKQAIMDLGPTGYPFEDYVSKVLEHEGYKTQVRTIVHGKCVNHEIDVIATKNTVIQEKIMVEAKFHNAVGIKMNVHVPLYTKSRFEDTKEQQGFSKAMVVTNTKASIDAKAYAGCVGMDLMSWGYPEHKSLRDLVEKYFLFPITAVTSLPKPIAQVLLNKQIVLCSQLCREESLLDELGLDQKIKEQIIKESSFVCSIG